MESSMTPEALRQGLRNDLFGKIRSVGINGGEPTLRDDIDKVVEVLFEELPNLKSISLITNAISHNQVIEAISKVGYITAKHNANLTVMVSLDGVGKVHDRVRGTKGNFVSSERVIDFLQSTEIPLTSAVGCTIIKENVFNIAELLEYCIEKNIYIKYRLGIPHQRLYTENQVKPYNLTNEERYHVGEFLQGLQMYYEKNEGQRFFYRTLFDQIILNSPRQAGCDWQHRGVTISSKGELSYCAVESPNLGNINEIDCGKVYFENEKKILQNILSARCPTCKHDYVGLPPKSIYLKNLAIKATRKFGVDLPKIVKAVRGVPSISRALSKRRFDKRISRLRLIQKDCLSTKGPKPTSKEKPERILICGWYGTETLGDKAILGGILEAMASSLSEMETCLASLNPYVSEITKQQMPELNRVKILSVEEAIRSIPEQDLIIFGGGPIMAINETADMQIIFETAKCKGVRTLIAGSGVGPLGDNWHNDSIKNILENATSRIYRDQKSLESARKLGIDISSDIVAEDPAFTWLHLKKDQVSDEGSKRAGQKILLLGLRDFPSHQYAKHLSSAQKKETQLNFEQSVLNSLSALTDKHPELIILPMPMCTNHFGGDDRWFYRKLFRHKKSLLSRIDPVLLGRELSPEEYVSYYNSADLALTMRFHSLVFTLSLGIPSVALDYTFGKGKVHSLAAKYNVPYMDLSTLTEGFIFDELDKILIQDRKETSSIKPDFSRQIQQFIVNEY